MPLTLPRTTGVCLSGTVPSPSWPDPLSPQAATVGSVLSARLSAPAAARARTPGKPLALAAAGRLVVVLSPNWPSELLPRGRTEPGEVMARLGELPQPMGTMPDMGVP